MSAIVAATLFILYLNVPSVLVREHGLPLLLAAAVPLLLAIPIAYRVFLRGESLRFPSLLLATALLLTLQAVSASLADNPMASFGTVRDWFLEGLVLVFLVLNAVRSRADFQLALGAIVAAGAVMGLIAIGQQLAGAMDNNLWGFGQLDAEIGSSDGRTQRRLSGPIGDTNRFAQILAVLLPLAAALAMTAKRPVVRGLSWCAMLLILGGVSLTFSRGALLALFLAVPFAIYLGMLRLRHVLIFVALGSVLFTALPQYFDRVASIGQAARSVMGLTAAGVMSADGATRGRLTEMQAAGLMFLDRPVVGVGLGMAPAHYAEYALVVGGKVRPGERRSHNLFLQLAAETGLLGLAAFMAVLLVAFVPLDRLRRRALDDPPLATLAAGLELSLFILITTSMFLHAAYVRYLWLLLALAGCLATIGQRPILGKLLNDLLHDTVLRLDHARR
ncbi:MAG: O-antigen ligase family protein [Pseudomonadota bacterium]